VDGLIRYYEPAISGESKLEQAMTGCEAPPLNSKFPAACCGEFQSVYPELFRVKFEKPYLSCYLKEKKI